MDSVVIVGAGFGGIGAAIELRRAGFSEITLLDAAPELGGTWYWNTYPGAACDVPSHLYSYSFAQRRDWSRLCSPQEEILAYLREVARAHGIDRLVEPSTEVVSCAWDESACRWTVTSRDGRTWTCSALVIATGQLNQPSIPAIGGPSKAIRFTRRAGTIPTTCGASGWRSSEPARAPSSSSRRSPRRPRR